MVCMGIILSQPPKTPSEELRRRMNWMTLDRRREMGWLALVQRCMCAEQYSTVLE